MGIRASVPAAVLAVCGTCLLGVTGPATAATAAGPVDTRAVIVGLGDQPRATPPGQFAPQVTPDLLQALTERQRVSPASPADTKKDAQKFDADLARLRQAVQGTDKAAATAALKDIIEDAKALMADIGQGP
ncbi:hypothetical protein [Kutzneria sp. CA-103260]|uniref:hypothetical protein n=1 Tax=Kutzneria sp. CA-103260 TaxID=2802641 RepID=UPI001BA761A6|nr:hypothetical protein [Kutzneria sp. CA-103260]QUQ71013.1 hypothetical protein JJ691_87960 [Kutzneria sp. CA-103260]